MHDVIINLKVLTEFYAHAHNNVQGVSFFSDHGALGCFYDETFKSLDHVAERIIGTLGSESLDLVEVAKASLQVLSKLKRSEADADTLFKVSLLLEERLVESVEMFKDSVSEGTLQLIGEIANKSESRQYKIKRRLSI